MRKFIVPIFVLVISFCAYAQEGNDVQVGLDHLQQNEVKSVGLVLSGGGAKGLSHVGVIKALEENHIPIDYISGTSMGAIVGGLYAIGLSPDEMIYLFKSPEFQDWYHGISEREYANYLYQGHATPSMINIDFKAKKKKGDEKGGLVVALPTSLISPYPMDIAVVQLFASSSAAAHNNFDNLMVPFFCMSSDVLHKKPCLLESGDLGSAIRASMTFPGYFKPITIDSTLMYDGGIYNNFPWQIMDEKYHPDFIIGAKCVLGEDISADEDDVIKQIESMITVDTDYDIPEDKGMVLAREYKFAMMDFDKVDELVRLGYENAQKYIPELKRRIAREVSDDEMNVKRVLFRQRCSELRFNKLEVEGNLSDKQKKYIAETVSAKKDTFDFDQAKRGYYRVVASKTVQTFYPTATYNSDSLFTLKFRTSKRQLLTISLGGNISSSSLNQGYVGMKYIHLDKHPWRLSLDLDIGQYYSGVSLYFRQDFSINPMLFYELEANFNRFDYFLSSQSIIISSALSNNVSENETFITGNIGTPISLYRNMLLKIGVTGGISYFTYFPTKSFTKYDTPDKGKLKYITSKVSLGKNTFNYRIFPTEGRKFNLEVRHILSWEQNTPGSLSQSRAVGHSYTKNSFVARFYLENYQNVTKWFSLGLLLDVAASTRMDMADYTSSLLVMPAFQPTVHSKTLFEACNRAPIYAGVAVSPIFKISPAMYFNLTGAYFQPYKQILPTENGGYEYSELFPMGSFMANLSFVWQSPIGPISLSCSYYDKAETKWYPQLNIGFLIFRNHGLNN